MKIEAPKWWSELEFTVTEEHIKLLNGARVSWNEQFNQGPCIDSLQPYGSTCIECDMAKILGVKPVMNAATGYTRYTDEQKNQFKKLHKETQAALHIFLKTGKMEIGDYVHDGWQNWRKK